MLHVESRSDLRAQCDAARGRGLSVGLVPTMGALHEGHLSLIRAARAQTDFVVVTIFVNPLQFGAGEDLSRYPRDLAGDLAQCERAGVDCVFAPSVEEMYTPAPLTTVHVDRLTADLCGRARPTHFDGVTTVVAKLFSIAGRCRAYFGRKDAQQLAVVRRMALDLDLPVEVVGCPIVREADGLAMSSRNAYLSSEERRAALVLSRSLLEAADAVRAGERAPRSLINSIRALVAREPRVELEYVEIRDPDELTPLDSLDSLDGEVLIALAARVGRTRLIDNVRVSIAAGDVAVDLGTRVQRA